MSDEQIVGKLLFKGDMVLESPLIIGSGEKGDFIDIKVLKDSKGRPYIPATSLAGVLKHYFNEKAEFDEFDNKLNKQLEYFWGSEGSKKRGGETYQSALLINDLVTSDEAKIKVRDGVEIDSKKGVAAKGAKYDYEVVEPGIKFSFDVEVNLRKAYDKDIFLKICTFLINGLTKAKVRLGAMTTKGFGKCRLTKAKFYHLDFNDKKDVLAWLSDDFSLISDKDLPLETFGEKGQEFSIDAHFGIKSSLIIKSYSGNPKDPDAVHITSNNQPTLPGTSIKGALRSRAARIIKSVSNNDEQIIQRLFGWVDTVDSSDRKFKSKLIVEETTIKNVAEEIQNRIKIDRFTGGVINGGLFDSMPLWSDKECSEAVSIQLTINNYEDWEAGLLLLILKDLWSEDLPIGGEKSIGRGVLTGLGAEIAYNNRNVSLARTEGNTLKISGDVNTLENFVKAFIAKCKGAVVA